MDARRPDPDQRGGAPEQRTPVPKLPLPQSEVVCIKYADPLGVRRYIDRKNFRGTLPELIDQTSRFLTQYTRVGATIRGFYREDEPEYPHEALREAVVNAVVHRDYNAWCEIIFAALGRQRKKHDSPDCDAEATRLPHSDAKPCTRTPTKRFIVTFRNGQEVEATTDLSPRQAIGLALARERGSISTPEYCAATGATDRMGLRDLHDMVAKGLLVVRGKKKGMRFFLA